MAVHRADRTVLDLLLPLHLRRDDRRAELGHGEVRQRRDALDERHGGLHAERQRLALPAERESVRLAEGALETVTRALRHARRLARAEVASRRREHAAVRHDLGLQEARPFGDVVVVAVVGGDLDRQVVPPLARRERPLVHAEEPLRRARRTVPRERAVQADAVDGRPRHAQDRLLAGLRVEGRPELHEVVHARRAALGPHGQRRLERRPGESRQRAQHENRTQCLFHLHLFIVVETTR